MNRAFLRPSAWLSAMIFSWGAVCAFAQTAPLNSQTRVSSFEYDPTTGLLKKEIVEPDTPNLCVVTTYDYDVYGNKISATTANCAGASGSAVFTSRTSTTSYASATGTYGISANGQFPTSSTNALGQTETKQFDPRYGGVSSLTGPNSLTTSWTYDEYGRKTLETRADGNKTKWDYAYCSGVNGGTETCSTVNGVPSGTGSGAWLVTETPLATNGTTANGLYTKTYFDSLGRTYRIQRETYSFYPANEDTWYYRVGLPAKSSKPYFSILSPIFDEFYYDALGRPTRILSPDEDGVLRETKTSYSGLSNTLTDAKNYVTTTTKNSQGKVVSILDAKNGTTTYEYDALDNLWRTTDPLGNQAKASYDGRGRKLIQNDPDMGVWTYAYNALGELVQQTSAKAETTTMTYDVLGRMTQRSEPEYVSKWYYDAYKGGGACSKGIGKLCQSEVSNGYSRKHVYDSLGRVQSTSSTISNLYTESLGYDADGRLSSRTYPSGLVVYYIYSTKGLLSAVRRDSSSGPLLWQPATIDAAGRVTQQLYGNSVWVTRLYSMMTGRVTNTKAGPGDSVLNTTYLRDAAGNVSARNEGTQNLLETFQYDELHRLTNSTVNSNGAGVVTKTYAYDALGNMTGRSDFSTSGGYIYNPSGSGSTRPHAVNRVNLAAGGYRTYGYDANGSMTSETWYDASNQVIPNKGRTNAFYSNGLPLSLQVGNAASASYYYGPERQRIVQSSYVSGSTVYLNSGGTGEVFYEEDFKTNGTTEERSYVMADGRAIVVVKKITTPSGSTEQTSYLHHDALGSTVVVTDSSGAVVERLAYEPFGKRRYAPGQDDPSNSITAQTTQRGYTFHEHVDYLGLINMNGRVYDPMLGRFMSADPIVQDPFHPQNLNRYSYVLNNPLGYTDPTGFRHISLGRVILGITVAALTGGMNWTTFQWVGFLAKDAGIIAGNVAANAVLGGFFSGAITTGNLQGALTSAITAGAMNVVGTAFPVGSNLAGNIIGHAVVGCVSAAMSGGGCGPAAISAGFAAYASPQASGNFAARTAQIAIIGGVANVLGGGKFANGALTAAYGYLFNYCGHDGKCARGESMSQSEALQVAREVYGATYPEDKLPPLKNFGFENLWFGSAKTTPAGFIYFDSTLYSKIDAINVDLFLGAYTHEIAHVNRTDFWDRLFDKIPMRFNEGHRIIDNVAEKKSETLYRAFKEKTGCCEF